MDLTAGRTSFRDSFISLGKKGQATFRPSLLVSCGET